ncbi:PREDICTED: uncharacterized protein LOC105511659 [Colobus angolensis palliatus]|uniref:uncharacterized protein LOC105511659 n=1 Tax=Colobus angolensis palliatus TaxID=336983 RepID=UPI0005F5491B|nr:PREDICTED: uncharacterized protein LOC105511659 [Colobus angolensis palliatus]
MYIGFDSRQLAGAEGGCRGELRGNSEVCWKGAGKAGGRETALRRKPQHGYCARTRSQAKTANSVTGARCGSKGRSHSDLGVQGRVLEGQGACRGHRTAMSRLHRRLGSQAPATQSPVIRRREPRASQHRGSCSGLRPWQAAQAAPSRPSVRRRAAEPRRSEPLPASASPYDPPLRSRPGLPGAPRRGGAFWQFLGAANAPLQGSAAGNAGFGAASPWPLRVFHPVCAARAAMAKWGQGDPRWIVEEREDGTNVNNWHWCGRQGGAAGGGLLPGSGEGRPAGAGTELGSVRGRRVAGVRGLGGHAPPQLLNAGLGLRLGSGASLGTETGEGGLQLPLFESWVGPHE